MKHENLRGKTRVQNAAVCCPFCKATLNIRIYLATQKVHSLSCPTCGVSASLKQITDARKVLNQKHISLETKERMLILLQENLHPFRQEKDLTHSDVIPSNPHAQTDLDTPPDDA